MAPDAGKDFRTSSPPRASSRSRKPVSRDPSPSLPEESASGDDSSLADKIKNKIKTKGLLNTRYPKETPVVGTPIEEQRRERILNRINPETPTSPLDLPPAFAGHLWKSLQGSCEKQILRVLGAAEMCHMSIPSLQTAFFRERNFYALKSKYGEGILFPLEYIDSILEWYPDFHPRIFAGSDLRTAYFYMANNDQMSVFHFNSLKGEKPVNMVFASLTFLARLKATMELDAVPAATTSAQNHTPGGTEPA